MLTLTACGGNFHASHADGAAADSPASESTTDVSAAQNTADFSATQNVADDPKNAEADGGGKETIIAPGLTEDQPQPFTVTSNHLYQMDETVAAIDIQDGKIVNDALLYTFTKATLYDDFSQAGLDEDALSPYTGAESECLLDDNGNLKKSVKVLLLELTVQNACAEPERNISSLSVCCVTSMNESGDRVEGSLLELFPGEIAYFSQPSGKKIGEDWKEYADYSLPVGQSKNLKVGWLIDTDQYDPKHLYLDLDDDEYRKLIHLDITDAT